MSQPRDQPFDHTMSFGDHLDELRKRVLLALAVPLPLACIMYFVSNTLIQWLLLPLFGVLRAAGLPERVQQLAPPEAIVIKIKLSFIAALIMTAPWVLWQAWAFIGPGLYRHERRFVRLLVPLSGILTVAAVALTYFVMLPLMLRVLVAVGASMSVQTPPSPETIDARAADALAANPIMPLLERSPANPQAGNVWVTWPDMKRHVAVTKHDGSGVEVIEVPPPLASRGTVMQDFRLSEYIGFVLLFLLGTVIAFQMPLVVMLLGWVGLASVEWLRARRKYALFICGIVAAVVTPSADVISMLVMMIPLYALYELGILLLMLAPASAVAEGRVWSLDRWGWRRADRPHPTHPTNPPHSAREPMDGPPAPSAQPRQADGTVPRSGGAPQKSDAQSTDGGEESP